jgi:hypothetical protein
VITMTENMDELLQKEAAGAAAHARPLDEGVLAAGTYDAILDLLAISLIPDEGSTERILLFADDKLPEIHTRVGTKQLDKTGQLWGVGDGDRTLFGAFEQASPGLKAIAYHVTPKNPLPPAEELMQLYGGRLIAAGFDQHLGRDHPRGLEFAVGLRQLSEANPENAVGAFIHSGFADEVADPETRRKLAYLHIALTNKNRKAALAHAQAISTAINLGAGERRDYERRRAIKERHDQDRAGERFTLDLATRKGTFGADYGVCIVSDGVAGSKEVSLVDRRPEDRQADYFVKERVGPNRAFYKVFLGNYMAVVHKYFGQVLGAVAKHDETNGAHYTVRIGGVPMEDFPVDVLEARRFEQGEAVYIQLEVSRMPGGRLNLNKLRDRVVDPWNWANAGISRHFQAKAYATTSKETRRAGLSRGISFSWYCAVESALEYGDLPDTPVQTPTEQ